MTKIKWGRALMLDDSIKIECRVLNILNYVSASYIKSECDLSNLDATGQLANELVGEVNKFNTIKVELTLLIRIFQGDGQVFDMNLKINTGNDFYKIDIIRGDIVEIFGNNSILPDLVLGQNAPLDLNLYNLT
jgi:hypothetical protein